MHSSTGFQWSKNGLYFSYQAFIWSIEGKATYEDRAGRFKGLVACRARCYPKEGVNDEGELSRWRGSHRHGVLLHLVRIRFQVVGGHPRAAVSQTGRDSEVEGGQERNS